MSVGSPIWQAPLQGRPKIAFIGIGIHGPSRREHHRAESHWCLHLYPYAARLEVDGKPVEIHPGSAGVLAPGADTYYSFPTRCQHACAHFTLDDAGDRLDMPAMQDLGDRFGEVYRAMEEAIASMPTQPLRAEVRLWDILWQLAAPQSSDSLLLSNCHPGLIRAMEIIELRLAERLSVEEIAREVDLSHNHLTRLFRDKCGTTVIGFIQQRRLQRALHLLENTQLPVKAIAAHVGAADTQQFNKMLHRHVGRSPRAVRGGKIATSQTTVKI